MTSRHQLNAFNFESFLPLNLFSVKCLGNSTCLFFLIFLVLTTSSVLLTLTPACSFVSDLFDLNSLFCRVPVKFSLFSLLSLLFCLASCLFLLVFCSCCTVTNVSSLLVVTSLQVLDFEFTDFFFFSFFFFLHALFSWIRICHSLF